MDRREFLQVTVGAAVASSLPVAATAVVAPPVVPGCSAPSVPGARAFAFSAGKWLCLDEVVSTPKRPPDDAVDGQMHYEVDEYADFSKVNIDAPKGLSIVGVSPDKSTLVYNQALNRNSSHCLIENFNLRYRST